MDNNHEFTACSAEAPENRISSSLNLAIETLQRLLDEGNGTVSSMAFRRRLEQQNIQDAREVVVQLKHYDFESPPGEVEPPKFQWRWHARSIYSEDAYEALRSQQQKEADRAAEAQYPSSESEPRRQHRQEESRMGTYVAAALEDLYQSDFGPENLPYVFDVHSDRPGSVYENVDVLAVDWRSDSLAEVVTVEVKLDFNAKLAQQAMNYTRFSDRVWIAVAVSGNSRDASLVLRDQDRLLFEHVVKQGIGILVCRRAVGRSFDVFPVQWPQRLNPDVVERSAFKERYRGRLEEAGVLEPRRLHRYPVF